MSGDRNGMEWNGNGIQCIFWHVLYLRHGIFEHNPGIFTQTKV